MHRSVSHLYGTFDSKSAQSQPLSWPLNSTPMRPRRAGPIRLGLLLGISSPGEEARQAFHWSVWKKNGSEHSLFLWRSRAADPWPFLLAISRRQFCEPRFVKNSRTVKRRPNIVRNVAHKSSATVLYCVINTDGPRMTMDLLSCARPKLSLSAFQWDFNTPGFMIIWYAYLEPMFICCSPHETVDLLSYSMVAH